MSASKDEEEKWWSPKLLGILEDPSTRQVISQFLEPVVQDIAETRIEIELQPTSNPGNFLDRCRRIGCCDSSIEDLYHRHVLPQLRPTSTRRRCGLLGVLRSHLVFSQLELYAQMYGWRFAGPEDLFDLATAAPEMRFQYCYAPGAIEPDARNRARAFWVTDVIQQHPKTRRIMYSEALPHVWTPGRSLLVVADIAS